MPDISSNAIIEKTAQLADDVRVGPFSYVGPEVRIGGGCTIENNVTITGKTVLGERNHVFPMAVIGTAEDAAGPGRCVIGEANTIREHVTIYAGSDTPTRVGNDNLIMIGCQVGGSARVGDHGIFANFFQIGAGATVEDYVRTSGFTLVQPGNVVGAYTFIAGHVNVEQDAPPYAMIHGVPFRVRGVNILNLRRCGFGEEDIQALKGAFRELFDGTGAKVNEGALARMRHSKPGNRHVRRLIEAISRAAARGGDANG